VQQIQEDLPQEKADNEQDPEGKKKALTAIIADYNARFGTNHSITEFDLYYQDVQKRIKDQQFPNADLPKKGREKIDITIVVDMLLTGFDSVCSSLAQFLFAEEQCSFGGCIGSFARLGNEHHAETCFALHHARVSVGRLFERNRLYHWADILKDAESKRVLVVNCCAGQ